MEGINWEAFWWGYGMIIGFGVFIGMLAAWAVRGGLRILANAIRWMWHAMTTPRPGEPTESHRRARLPDDPL